MNAGNRKGGTIPRCEGPREVEMFSTKNKSETTQILALLQEASVHPVRSVLNALHSLPPQLRMAYSTLGIPNNEGL